MNKGFMLINSNGHKDQSKRGKEMNKKGFTLTEILIVLVVAGILLALILPNTLKAIERANITEHENNLNTLQVGLFMCYTETKDWEVCDTTLELVTGNFLSENPSTNPPFPGIVYEPAPNVNGVGYVACSTGLPAAPILKDCAITNE